MKELVAKPQRRKPEQLRAKVDHGDTIALRPARVQHGLAPQHKVTVEGSKKKKERWRDKEKKKFKTICTQSLHFFFFYAHLALPNGRTASPVAETSSSWAVINAGSLGM